jgi:hypothetical protein
MVGVKNVGSLPSVKIKSDGETIEPKKRRVVRKSVRCTYRSHIIHAEISIVVSIDFVEDLPQIRTCLPTSPCTLRNREITFLST